MNKFVSFIGYDVSDIRNFVLRLKRLKMTLSVSVAVKKWLCVLDNAHKLSFFPLQQAVQPTSEQFPLCSKQP
jgi:hypothetical protein